MQMMFDGIEGYDPKHHLLTIGEHDEPLAVYSIDHKKIVLPFEYQYVEYEDEHVFYERWRDCCGEVHKYDDLI